MKIKKTEQILQLFDDRRTLNTRRNNVGVSPFAARHIVVSIKLCKQVYFSSFLAASIVSSKVIFRA